MTLTERLRDSLRRTREKLGLPRPIGEAPSFEALEESLLLADVGLPATREILSTLRARTFVRSFSTCWCVRPRPPLPPLRAPG